MYLEYFGLLKAPFHITPDPDFLYMSPSHREAFAALFYGVEQRKGFISVTGEVGAGKTTILRAFMKRVDENAVRPVYLFNPALTFQELLILTLRGLGSTPEPGRTNAELLDQLNWLLIDEYRAGHNVVLIVDEAQNMPVETLEQMRMLSNLETASDKLLQIVLVGQPELEDKLNLHELRQLKQRCAVRSVVKPLRADESDEYITHRLRMAGCPREDVFSPSARRAIVRHAKGSPRTINILCDNAMIAGFGSQQELISAAIVKAVIRDMGATSRVKQAPRWAWAAAIAAGGIVVGALVSQVGLLGGGGLANRGMVPVEASVDPALGTKPMVAKVEVPAAEREAPKAEPEKKVEVTTPVPAAAETTAPAKTGAAPVMAEGPKAEVAKAEATKPDALTPMEAPKVEAEISAPKAAEPVKAVEPAKVEDPKPAAAPATVVASVGAALAEKTAAEAKPDPAKRTALAKITSVEAPAVEKPVVDGPVKAEAPAKAAEPAHAKAETPKPAVVDGPVQPVVEKPAAEVAPKPKEAPAKAVTPPAETAPLEKAPATPPAKADTPKPEPVKAPLEKKTEETHSAAALPLAASDTLQKRVVVNGDCLSRLAREVYGTGDTAIVNALHRYNPQILNPDLILPGQTVVFPVAALVGAQTTAASPATPAAAEPASGASP